MAMGENFVVIWSARACSGKVLLNRRQHSGMFLRPISANGTANAKPNRLYRGLDALLPHKEALEKFLKQRFGELFAVEYDLLLYDVTGSLG
jgi:hypothetical protein